MENQSKYNIDNLKQFKSTFNNTPTKQIRVPEIFVDQILEYAHQLDDSNKKNKTDFSLMQVKLSAIIEKIDNKEKGYKSNSASQLIADIKQIINDEN